MMYDILEPIVENDGAFRVYSLFPFDPKKQFEVLIEGQTYVVNSHQTIHFEADKPHSYRNSGETTVTYFETIHYSS